METIASRSIFRQFTALFAVVGFITCIHSPGTAAGWSTMAPMAGLRSGHSGAAINGKLYIAGGYGPGYGTTTVTLEEYTPATNTWAVKSPEPTSRANAAAGAINGKLYVAGGETAIGSSALTTLNEYDPSTDIWQPRSALPSGVASAAVTALSGKLYLAGGRSGFAIRASLLIYDQATNTWEAKADLPTPVWGASAHSLDGKIYVCGGSTVTFGYGDTNIVQVYDPATNTWSPGPSLPGLRRGMALATIGNRLFAAGGFGGAATGYVDFFQEYNLVINKWITHPQMPVATYGPIGAIINNVLYVSGGENPGGFSGNTYAYSFDVSASPPTILSATATSPNKVDITFSEMMSADVFSTSRYSIAGTGKGTLVTNPSAVSFLSGNTYRLTWNTGAMINEESFQLTISPTLPDTTGQQLSGQNVFTLFVPLPEKVAFTGTNFATPANHSDIITADITRDGIDDLVVAYNNDNMVRIYPGTGTGTFGAAIEYAAGTNPQALATGDFNNDSKLDLAIRHRGTVNNTVGIMLGNNSGGLDPVTIFSTLVAGGTSLATGDFNRDGKLDLVTSNEIGSSNCVMLGNGAGGFSSTTNVSGAQFNHGIITRDFNRDGITDFAVTSTDVETFAIHLGDATGSFGPATTYQTVQNPLQLTAGDWNMDGTADLAVASSDTNTIAIHYGSSAGTFTTSSTITYTPGTGGGGGDIKTADFNDDGKPDLALTKNATNVLVFLNDGSGSFDAGNESITGFNPSPLAVGDFNRDGYADIATGNQNGFNVTVLLNRTIHRNNLFPVNTRYNLQTTNTSSFTTTRVEPVDLNRDGIQDLIISYFISDHFTILYGLPDGAFSSPVQIVAGSNINQVSVGDFNGDGRPDLAAAVSKYPTSSGGVAIMLANASGGFSAPVYYPVCGAVIQTADINKDGKLDIVYNYVRDVRVRMGDGTGAFGAATLYDAEYNTGMTVADFNSDGNMDVSMVNSITDGTTKSASIMYGNGTGGFGAPVTIPVSSNLIDTAAGDFNRDGRTDLAIMSQHSTNNIHIRLQQPDGSLGPLTAYSTGGSGIYMEVADVNRDGKVDIVAPTGNNRLALLQGIGDGRFSTFIHYPTGPGNMSGVGVSDFNRDGMLDLVTTYRGFVGTTATVAILLNRGAHFSWSGAGVAPANLPTRFTDDALLTFVTHRGVSTDTSITLEAMHLGFDNGFGVPLTSSQVNALIAKLHIYSHKFVNGQIQYVSIAQYTNLQLDAQGRVYLKLPDIIETEIPWGTSKPFSVFVETAANAATQSPNKFRISHLTSFSTRVKHTLSGTPLRPEFTPDVASRAGGTSIGPIWWDGGGADNYWRTPLNWSHDVIPSVSDDVLFGTTSTKNSIASLGHSVRNLHIQPGYTGTLDFSFGYGLDIAEDLLEDGGSIIGNGRVSVGGDYLRTSPGTADYHFTLIFDGPGVQTFQPGAGGMNLRELNKSQVPPSILNILGPVTATDGFYAGGEVNLFADVTVTGISSFGPFAATSVGNNGILKIHPGRTLDARGVHFLQNNGTFNQLGSGRIRRNSAALQFTDAAGNPTPAPKFPDPLYLSMADDDENTSGAVADVTTAVVADPETGDSETVPLTEVPGFMPLFRSGPLPAGSGPAIPGDGILQSGGTHTIQAVYLDNEDSDDTTSTFALLRGLDCYLDEGFEAPNIQPAGSLTGWSGNGPTIFPALAAIDHDTTNGAYRVSVFSNSSRYRMAGWLNNRADWLPYQQIGSDHYVRAKYYMYAQPLSGESFEAGAQIPNFNIRLASRFAVTAGLRIQSHDRLDPEGFSMGQELRPSTDPNNPSIYRLDFDPIDIPFLQTATGEGIMSGFEVLTLDPRDHGILCMTERLIGCYPASLISDDKALQTKIYATTDEDAGNLRIFNSQTDIGFYNIAPYPPGTPPGYLPPAEFSTPLATATESSAGVTLDSRAVLPDRIGFLERAFYAGNADGTAGHPERIRAAADQQYKIRWHVTSTRPTTNQGWLWMGHRMVRFAYTQTLQLSGGRGSNAPNSRTIIQQSVPGVGSLNPDRNGSENGGWYTSIVNSPLDPDIRPEFASGVPVDIRMPNIMAQPGPGVDSISARDLKLSASIYDTISNGTGKEHEAALFTIDRIEVRSYPRVED